MINLGTLKEISDLRSIWPHEALNFTPWVAENVELLAHLMADREFVGSEWLEYLNAMGIHMTCSWRKADFLY